MCSISNYYTKIFFSLFFSIFIILSNQPNANSELNTIYIDSLDNSYINSLYNNNLEYFSNNISYKSEFPAYDTTQILETNPNSNDTNQVLHINQNDFMYSDNFRYTINGDLPLLENDIDPLKLGVFSGMFGTFIAIQHIYQVNTIWSKNVKFKFMEDGNYALYSDKIGHFYGAYLGGYLYSEFFMWSGLSYKNATLVGSLLGLAYSTYVEIMDGFADGWGFSPSDFYSDVAGFGFFLLQNQVPWLQNITPKFMYYPSEWHGDISRKDSKIFMDDYSSQTFYLTFNIYNILPEKYKHYWIPWLQLTIGYAARNLSEPALEGYDPNNAIKYSDLVAGSPRLIIGLDYDFVKLLPDGIPLWNWLRQSLNYIKFPAPAIEISHLGTRFMLMYPFLKF